MRRSHLASLSLGLAAFLFGASFVVVKEAVTLVSPLSFVGWRFLLGGAALLLLAMPKTREIWRDGMGAGVLLFTGFALQTEGLARTSASNSGLITGLFVVFTPLLAAVVGRTRVGRWAVAAALTAFAGLALLTLRDGFDLAAGDLLTVGCAVAFSGHIVVVSRVAARHRVVPFTTVQLLLTGVLALAAAGVGGSLTLPGRAVMPALLLTALGVSAGAYLAQVWAQQVVGAERAAIILALEPAFAAATAAIVLGERLDGRGWVGAGLILLAIYAVVTRGSEALIEAEAVSAAH